MSRKRAFILGAGFSKQAGMPLATELTSLILDGPGLRDHKEMQAWLNGFKQRLSATEGAGDDGSRFHLNVEQLFDFAAYDEELWRMRQQLCQAGRQAGSTPWSKAEGISAWLGYMEEDLAHVIWDAQQKADPGPIKRLAERLSADDTILRARSTITWTNSSATHSKSSMIVCDAGWTGNRTDSTQVPFSECGVG